jgi:hypothetical protein
MPKKKRDPYGLDDAFADPEESDLGKIADIIFSHKEPITVPVTGYRDGKRLEMDAEDLLDIVRSQGLPCVLRMLANMPEDVEGYNHALVVTLGRVADRIEREIEWI